MCVYHVCADADRHNSCALKFDIVFLGHIDFTSRGERRTLYTHLSELHAWTAVFPAISPSTRGTCKWPPTVGLSDHAPSSAAPPPSTWERNMRRIRWYGEFSCLQFVWYEQYTMNIKLLDVFPLAYTNSVSIHWTGLQEWTNGPDYWTHLNCYKMPFSV